MITASRNASTCARNTGSTSAPPTFDKPPRQQSTSQAKPLSLTYLGGVSQGSFSVQIYAVEVRANDGTQQLFPLALTLLGGRVVGTR